MTFLRAMMTAIMTIIMDKVLSTGQSIGGYHLVDVNMIVMIQLTVVIMTMMIGTTLVKTVKSIDDRTVFCYRW